MAARPNRLSRIPCVQPLYGETYLQAVQRQKHLADHWRRIAEAKHQVDDGPPFSLVPITSKLKKLLSEGERLSHIEKDNKHLLRDILRLMKGPGSVDHYHRHRKENKSLSYDARQAFIKSINQENKKLLWRIINTKTSYDHYRMELDYQERIRCRRGREYVFRLWNELTEERNMYIRTGKHPINRRERMDRGELQARYEETHRYCLPPQPQPLHQARPVPRSCRSPPGARPADHTRCFTSVPVLPPLVTSQHPSSACQGGDGDTAMKENKAMKLRKEASKKKIEAFSSWYSSTTGSGKGGGQNKDMNQSACPELLPIFNSSQNKNNFCGRLRNQSKILAVPPAANKVSLEKSSERGLEKLLHGSDCTAHPRLLPALPTRDRGGRKPETIRVADMSNSAVSPARHKSLQHAFSTILVGDKRRQSPSNWRRVMKHSNKISDNATHLSTRQSVPVINRDCDPTTRQGNSSTLSSNNVQDECRAKFPGSVCLLQPIQQPSIEINKQIADDKHHSVKPMANNFASDKSFCGISFSAKSRLEDKEISLTTEVSHNVPHDCHDLADQVGLFQAFFSKQRQRLDLVANSISMSSSTNTWNAHSLKRQSKRHSEKSQGSHDLHRKNPSQKSVPTDIASGNQHLSPILQLSDCPCSKPSPLTARKSYRKEKSPRNCTLADGELAKVVTSPDTDLKNSHVSPKDNDSSDNIQQNGDPPPLHSDSLSSHKSYREMESASAYQDSQDLTQSQRSDLLLAEEALKQSPVMTDRHESPRSDISGSWDSCADVALQVSSSGSQCESLTSENQTPNILSSIPAVVVVKELFQVEGEMAVEEKEEDVMCAVSSDED